jgi:hypothetical protein
MITDEKRRRFRATQKTELAMIHEAEGLKKLTKTLGEEEIDPIDSLICEWGTHMLTTFSHGDAVVPMVMRLFYANPRGYRKRTEARRRFAENGVHKGR